jgi:hypothetical protein
MYFISAVASKIFITFKVKRYLLEFDDRPSDIYVASFMRSGTTWVQMIIYQLTTDGEMNFESMSDVSPWFEQSLRQEEFLNHLPAPRIFKTHVPYKLVRKKWQGKFIYVYRNGMDTAVSQYYHYKNLGNPSLTFEASFANSFLNKNNSSLVPWFKHVADWLKNKKNLDILYVSYEELSNDLEGTIRKIIKFFNLDVKESQFPRILERCSFKFMKSHEDKFDNLAEEKKRQKQMQLNQFFRKGKTNEGEKYFNRELKKIYLEFFNKYLSKFDLDSYKPKMTGE